MNFDVHSRTIFLTVMGSRAYGFSTPESDWDYRGIIIPPIDSYIGVLNKFEHLVDTDKSKHVYKYFPSGLLVDSEAEHPDMQLLELTKFAGLAAQCNPSIIEILFSPDNNWAINTPIMRKLLDKRNLFITKAAKPRFCGYALSQLERIERHRRWLLNPPKAKPERKDFGLPNKPLIDADQLGAAEAIINRSLGEFISQHEDFVDEDMKIEMSNFLKRSMREAWVAINTKVPYPVGINAEFPSLEDALFYSEGKALGLSENFLSILNAEKRYRAALKEWQNYQNWLATRNPERAELERKFGYDCKHAVHLVRLLRMAREILETGEVKVLRPDAEELRSIRNGAWDYERLVEFARTEDVALNDVMHKSKLKPKPDMQELHNLICEMVFEFNMSTSDDIICNNIKNMLASGFSYHD
jgi:uncharacterized protein